MVEKEALVYGLRLHPRFYSVTRVRGRAVSTLTSHISMKPRTDSLLPPAVLCRSLWSRLKGAKQMPLPNLNYDLPTGLPVRHTELKPWLAEEAMTPLGRELWQLAREIEQSDEAALSEEEIEKELSKRRGGFVEDGE
jgi:hypothetical protein